MTEKVSGPFGPPDKMLAFETEALPACLLVWKVFLHMLLCVICALLLFILVRTGSALADQLLISEIMDFWLETQGRQSRRTGVKIRPRQMR